VHQFINVTLAGLVQGAVFAAFALALVLIWRSTRIVNFAQGAMAAATAFVALALIHGGQSYWLALVVALVCGFVFGALVERVLIRRVEGGPELNAVIVTLGLFVAIEAVIAIVAGNQVQAFPAPFSLRGFSVGGARATEDRTLAGLLIAGGGIVSPSFMDGLIIYGFVAAVLGGLDSPVGAVVGGLLVGLLLAYVSQYVDKNLVDIAALVVLVVVLLVRPGGLFSSSTARRA